MNNLSDIYRDGLHYDIMNNFDYDLEFYKTYIRKKSKILELGAGTGRLSIPLAKHSDSLDYYGLDNCESMLLRAKDKALKVSSKINWILADMTDFDFDFAFDLIIIPFDAFCHLHTYNNIYNCLQNIYKHLDSNGCLILDINNPILSKLLKDKNEISIRARYKNPVGLDQVIVEQKSKYDQSTQIHSIYWNFIISNKSHNQKLVKRVFFPQEIDNYIAFCGYKLTAKYGWFDKTKYESQSKRQILVCKKNIAH